MPYANIFEILFTKNGSMKHLNFENLGDNCEFGFFLRSKGIESGSLFRWALIENYNGFIDLLRDNFKLLYKLENLEPSYRNMVRDKKYGICFHTELFSHQENGIWIFDDNNNELENKYKVEKQKITYLITKFKNSVASKDTVFVIKKNNNSIEPLLKEIEKELHKIGNPKILYVKLADDKNSSGSVIHFSGSLFYGFIDRFSEYHKADEISENCWDKIIENFQKLIEQSY